MDLDPLAVAAATLAAFLLGGAYYAVLGDRLAAVSPAAASADAAPSPRTLVVELARCLVLATVVAGIADRARVEVLGGGLLLGLVLWVGFPLVLWVGAVVHEATPVELAAIHAGDWLVKLLVIGTLVAVLQ